MSKPFEETLTCPSCGAQKVITCWSSVNVTNDPQLKRDLIQGRLTCFTCDGCGRQAKVSYNLLYHDMDQKLLFWLRFPDERGSLEIEPEAKQAWQAVAPGYTCRVVSSSDELLEKILIFDEGLDDRAIEVFKFLVSSAEAIDLEEPIYLKKTKRSLFRGKRLILRHVQPDGGRVDRSYAMDQFAPALELAQRYLVPPSPSEDQWLYVDREYACRKLEEGGAIHRSPARSQSTVPQEAVEKVRQGDTGEQLTLSLPSEHPQDVPADSRVESLRTLIGLYLTGAMPLVEGKLQSDPVRRAVQMFIFGAVDFMSQSEGLTESQFHQLVDGVLESYDLDDYPPENFCRLIPQWVERSPRIEDIMRMGAQSIRMYAAERDAQAPLDLAQAVQFAERHPDAVTGQ